MNRIAHLEVLRWLMEAEVARSLVGGWEWVNLAVGLLGECWLPMNVAAERAVREGRRGQAWTEGARRRQEAAAAADVARAGGWGCGAAVAVCPTRAPWCGERGQRRAGGC